MAKASSKVSDADKQREVGQFLSSLTMSEEALGRELRRITTDYTPNARSDLFRHISTNIGDAVITDPAKVRVIFEQLRPQKRAKANVEYIGSLLKLMDSLANRDLAARSELAFKFQSLMEDAQKATGSVVTEEQLITIALEWRPPRRIFVDLLKAITHKGEGMQANTKVWARMMAPTLGMRSRKNMISPTEAQEIVEVLSSLKRSGLSDELLLAIPRIAAVGGDEVLALAEKSGLLEVLGGAVESRRGTAPGPVPHSSEDRSTSRLSASQSSILKTLTEEFARGSEDLAAAKGELEEFKGRFKNVVNEKKDLRLKLESAESRHTRDVQRINDQLTRTKSELEVQDKKLRTATERNSMLEIEIQTLEHQSETRAELDHQENQAIVEQVYTKPLSRALSLVASAKERNPELGQLLAIEKQVLNCVKKIERHLNVELGLGRGALVDPESD